MFIFTSSYATLMLFLILFPESFQLHYLLIASMFIGGIGLFLTGPFPLLPNRISIMEAGLVVLGVGSAIGFCFSSAESLKSLKSRFPPNIHE